MITFKPLWKTLIDREMNKSELIKAGISSATLAKLSKDGNVNIDTLEKICQYLECSIVDVIEFIPDKNE